MKKKAIERIPYLKLEKLSRKKDTKYIGVTAVKIISHEKHLFLEVYKNKKGAKDVPLVRIVLTKKDFGTYFPEKGKWTRQKIKSEQYYNGMVWQTPEDARSTWGQMKKQNVLQSEEDLKRIKSYCKESHVWDEERWWEFIYNHQDEIVIEARKKTEKRKYERRQNALNDRIAHTEPLPEKEILEKAEIYLGNTHYLYYKKRGSWAQIACTKCGGVTDARWKAGESYESQFQRCTEEPREGHLGTCPMCGAHGIYKCQGKVKGPHSKAIHLFLGQKYKETGMVLRYIEVTKKWSLEQIAGEKGTEMYNASEEISGVEIARAYFESGKECQIDYHKHSWYSGEDFWDDCNLYGNANIVIKEARIMPETYEEMKGTDFQYSALQEYVKEVGEVNPIDFFERYQQTPQIEVLVKMGLIGVVEKLVKCNYGIVASQYATRPETFLGIRKERVKQLIAKKGDTSLLDVMKMEKRMQQVWTDEQIEHIAETELRTGQIEVAIQYMSIQQLLNRIEKYAGCEYGTGCSRAVGRIREIATIYTDYLNMRAALGYDLSNTVYQQPRRLDAAHASMVAETNKEEADKRIAEVNVKFANIKKSYRRLRKQYYYEDDDYIIRPARSAAEIVEEGRILHHCVGGDSYLKKHDNGETYILMLRFKEEPDIPYITIEIDGQRVLQWYGSKDQKPNQAEMQKWIDDYLERIRTGNMTHEVMMEIA